jgi:hypothetical protein
MHALCGHAESRMKFGDTSTGSVLSHTVAMATEMVASKTYRCHMNNHTTEVCMSTPVEKRDSTNSSGNSGNDGLTSHLKACYNPVGEYICTVFAATTCLQPRLLTSA